jgi:hypothetical protein
MHKESVRIYGGDVIMRKLGKDEPTLTFNGSELILNEDKQITSKIIESPDDCDGLMLPLVFDAIVAYCIRECGLRGIGGFTPDQIRKFAEDVIRERLSKQSKESQHPQTE